MPPPEHGSICPHEPPVLKLLQSVVQRDLLLAMRRRSDVANAVLFFVIVVSLFPFGVGPEANLLRAIAPGVVWVAALLASMLALNRLFAADHADGTLEQMLLKLERQIVEAALRRYNNNRERVARELGVARSTLFKRLKEWGLTRQEEESE